MPIRNRILSLLPVLFLVSCGTRTPESETAAFPNLLAPIKMAQFSVGAWYPSCTLSGCWLDFTAAEGVSARRFQVRFDSGSYGAKTGGKLYFECKNGSKVNVELPGSMDPGWMSPWINNPCSGPVLKITMKAGLDGTWGEGVVSYWRKLI